MTPMRTGGDCTAAESPPHPILFRPVPGGRAGFLAQGPRKGSSGLARVLGRGASTLGCGSLLNLFLLPAMGMGIRTPKTTVPRSPTAPSWTRTTTGWEMTVTMTMTTMASLTTQHLVQTTAASSLTPTRRTQMVSTGQEGGGRAAWACPGPD